MNQVSLDRKAERVMSDTSSWSAVAAAWAENIAYVEQMKDPVTKALLAAATPGPGDVVLEVGAGTGELAREVAGRVAPGGRVIATDAADGMVEVMRARIGTLPDIEIQLCDAAATGLPDGQVNAVLARMSLMFSVDPAAAVQEAMRVLAVGGRYAAATWGGPFENIWMSSVGMAAAMNGAIQGVSPMGPGGPFSLNEPKELAVLLEDAGFEEVVVEDVAFSVTFPDTDTHFAHVSALAGPLAVALTAASADLRSAVRRTAADNVAGFVTDDGLVFPALARIVSGRRPS
jgi:SAM-dependent methyltransferase